jgi:hypothetical protein
VEGSVEARPDSAPKGVVLVTALEVPDWISMSSHLPCVSQFIFMPFSADFLRRQLMLRIRDDRLVTRFQSSLIVDCASDDCMIHYFYLRIVNASAVCVK